MKSGLVKVILKIEYSNALAKAQEEKLKIMLL